MADIMDKRRLVEAIRDYADSLDEHVEIDDVYIQLRWLALEIEKGDYDA